MVSRPQRVAADGGLVVGRGLSSPEGGRKGRPYALVKRVAVLLNFRSLQLSERASASCRRLPGGRAERATAGCISKQIH
jgi:hypothetical protein